MIDRRKSKSSAQTSYFTVRTVVTRARRKSKTNGPRDVWYVL